MRTSCAWTVVIVTFFVITGCRRYVAVPVRVEDAETGAPIQGAVVRSEYAGTDGWRLIDFIPFATQMRELRRSAGHSDADGMATVELTADAKTFFQGVSAEAKGYVESRPAPVSKEVVERVRRSRGAGEGSIEPVARITMLAEPRPRVVLVLPDGYRGVLRVMSKVSTEPHVPGQRLFLHRVSPDAIVNIEVPVMPTRYDHRSPASFAARYAIGHELPSAGRALDTDVALRVVELRSDQYLLIVGTRADRDAANAYVSPRGIPDDSRWRAIWQTGKIPTVEAR